MTEMLSQPGVYLMPPTGEVEPDPAVVPDDISALVNPEVIEEAALEVAFSYAAYVPKIGSTAMAEVTVEAPIDRAAERMAAEEERWHYLNNLEATGFDDEKDRQRIETVDYLAAIGYPVVNFASFSRKANEKRQRERELSCDHGYRGRQPWAI